MVFLSCTDHPQPNIVPRSTSEPLLLRYACLHPKWGRRVCVEAIPAGRSGPEGLRARHSGCVALGGIPGAAVDLTVGALAG